MDYSSSIFGASLQTVKRAIGSTVTILAFGGCSQATDESDIYMVPTGGSASGGSASSGGAPTEGTGGQELGEGAGGTTSGGQTSTGGTSQSTGGLDGTGGLEPAPTPDVNDVIPSQGCGAMPSDPKGSWVDQPMLDIDGKQRSWAIRLPTNYDPNRAYPITFEFHGCGSKTNNVPMENAAGDEAIHVRGASIDKCWHDLATGNVDDSTESVDLAFFDAMLDEVKQSTCIDENRVFGVGYSSGAWLMTIMACKRRDTLRALGTIAGADWVHINNLGPPVCSDGHVAQMYISDTGDTGSNRWDNHKSAQARLVEANGCAPDSEVAVAPAPCVRFQGCGDYPVQRCITSGNGHGRQDGYAPGAFWSFFSEFLAEQ